MTVLDLSIRLYVLSLGFDTLYLVYIGLDLFLLVHHITWSGIGLLYVVWTII